MTDTAPFNTGEFEHRSGEPLSGGEGLCLATNLTSELLPPAFPSSSCVGLVGLEQRDVVGPVLLPTEKDEEERVGLC